MGFGYIVKELLRDRKMSIKQLAEKARIPVNTLYSITKRDSIRVDPVIAARICDALEVSIGELLSLQPSVDTPENRIAIESGLTAFLEASDEFTRKTRERIESLKVEDEERLRAIEYEAEKDAQKKIAAFISSPIGRSIIYCFFELNERGQDEAEKRIYELTEIPKYQYIGTAKESTLPTQEKPSEG